MTAVTGIRRVAVIDIGKTNAKVALVDLETLSELAVRKTANTVRTEGPYPHYDIATLWRFILDALHDLATAHRIDAISVTTHGATAALLDREGALALPVLDYEHTGPDALAAQYDAVRPAFAETGSPRLPVGLNLGAQLFWLQHRFPADFARVRAIVPYPQYWSYRLSGVMANEATSLGCHTDLWDPSRGTFSSMVDALGWRDLFAPVHSAFERLGPLLPDVARATGLDPATPVFCGIHDSNASLLPHLKRRQPPFAVVSTGTWVIVMAIGGVATTLDPARDTLVNVNALGQPVPSARFMGGREFESIVGQSAVPPGEDDIDAVLSTPILLLPAVQQGSGPFPDRTAAWAPERPADQGQLQAAASFYLAMMTATCLELAGAAGTIVVEGPLAANGPFTRMLAAATGRPVVAETRALTGTSVGAALLTGGRMLPPVPAPTQEQSPDPAMVAYARAWRERVG